MPNLRHTPIGAALLVALVGCSPVATPAATASPSPSATATTASVTPTATQSYSAGEQEARELVGVRYYEVQDQVASDYTVSLNALYQVMGTPLVEKQLSLLQKNRVAKLTQDGRIKAEVRSVQPEGTNGFRVEACVDTSAVVLRDSAGKAVSSNKYPRVLHTFELKPVTGALRAVSNEATATAC